MAVVVGEAAVRLRPEASRFGSEAEAEIDGKLPGVAKKAAGYFAAAFAVVGVGAFLKNAVSEASDLEESASKVGVVFGDAADTVEAFASTAASSLGLSEAAALGATGTFGNLLRSIGLTEDESADMSTSMVQLAGDLASFNNVDPTVALDALRSGLVGETEPLKAFGVNMNEAALSAKAVELGLADAGEQLDANAKAQAAYALIMEQTSLAQGDFARTSDGLANQQRIIAAQFSDLSARVGGLLVPSLGNAAGMVSGTLMPALLRLTEPLPAIGEALGRVGDLFRLGFSDGLDAVFEAAEGTEGFARTLLVVAGNVGDLSAVFREAFVDGAAGSAHLGGEGLLGFAVTAGAAARSIFDSFSAAWQGIVEVVGPVLAQLQAALGPALAAIGESLSGAFGGGGGGGFLMGLADTIGSVLEVIGPMIATYVTRWAEVFQAVLPALVQIVEAVVPVIVDLFKQIGPVLAQLAPVISQVAGIFATTLVGVIEALLPVLPVLLDALAAVAQVLAGALLSVLQALIPVLPPILEAFAQIAVVLAGVLAQALAAIVPIIPTLVEALVALVMAALVPLLPLLPMLAELLLMVITALAPLIPPVIQIVALLIQLAVAAIVPLLPFFPMLVGLIGTLLAAFMPIISVLAQVIGAFVGMAAAVTSVVVGFVSTIVGAWTSLWTGITGLVTKIVSGAKGGFQSLKDGVVSIFSGIADFISSAFRGIGGAIKGAINAVISGINNTVISGINVVIDGANLLNPFDDIPRVPNIPTFHSGGVYDSGSASGEGIALLRDNELVATPEQRRTANDLLGALLAGDLNGPAAGGTAGTLGGGIVINEHIHAVPGESAGTVAARASAAVVWNLNNGITRRVGADALEPALR